MKIRKSMAVAIVGALLGNAAVSQTVTISTGGDYHIVSSEAEASARGLSNYLVIEKAATVVVTATEPTTVWLYPFLIVPRLDVRAGASVTAYLSEAADVVAAEGASISLGKFDPVWSPDIDASWSLVGGEPLFWLDPSCAATLHYVTNSTGEAVSQDGYRYAWKVYDRRTPGDTTERYLYNNRYKQGDASAENVVPIIKTDRADGLATLAFGASRRIYFYSNTTSSAESSFVRAKTILSVYNPTLGGGKAIFGSCGDQIAFGRSANSLESTITTNSFVGRLDGVPMDTDKAYFKTGWQLLTLYGNGEPIDGLGYSKRPSGGHPQSADCGSMTYGETLFFAEELTATQVHRIESYLAAKWGLTVETSASELDFIARVYGKGTVTLQDDFRLGGAFNGTLNANGKKIEVEGASLPPGDEVVPTEGCLAWFDPDYPDAITYYNKDRAKSVYSRIGWDQDGAYRMWCGGTGYESRSPDVKLAARGFGVSRRWLVYEGSHVLRLSQLPSTASSANPLSPKTVVLVQDSSRGGGTPFQTGINGDAPPVRCRIEAGEDGDADVLIWRYGTTQTTFANSLTRLNGNVVDGAKTGFTGRPEVFSVANPTSFSTGIFGYYKNNGTTYGEDQGEILMFEDELPAATLSKIEAYLMWKWFGEAHDGYSALGAMSLKGDGDVTVARNEMMPIASDFSGVATIKSDALVFSVAKDGSSSDRVITKGGLVLPDIVTISVSFAADVKIDELVLLSAQEGLTGASSVSLSIVGTKHEYRIVRDAKSIRLERIKPGLVLVVR